MDWKYLLSLELEDPGCDASVLCEFRAQLVEGKAQTLLLDTLLERSPTLGRVKAHGKQRTHSTHVLARGRAINRVELVHETMRHALDALAVVAPEWLLAQVQPEWVARYQRRGEDPRLPKSKEQRIASANTIGAEGIALLSALFAPTAPDWLRQIPAVQTLRRVWVQNYQQTPQGTQWREAEDIPPASQYLRSREEFASSIKSDEEPV